MKEIFKKAGDFGKFLFDCENSIPVAEEKTENEKINEIDQMLRVFVFSTIGMSETQQQKRDFYRGVCDTAKEILPQLEKITTINLEQKQDLKRNLLFLEKKLNEDMESRDKWFTYAQTSLKNTLDTLEAL